MEKEIWLPLQNLGLTPGISQYGSVKGQAELRMRKEGASTRPLVSLGTGFLEGNFDTRFLTTLGLLL